MEQPLSESDEVDGKYSIVRHLDAGGMGHIYEAEDRSLGRRIALKVLPAAMQLDDVARERLLREGRAAAGVRHPGVVRIYEVGSDGQTDYVAMELLQGENLHDRLLREGRLPIATVQELGVALADAMTAMHNAGVIHRDLKPKNIFLAQEGEARAVLKVLDFGVAKNIASGAATITETGQVFGTLHYMAPEQLRGAKNADARSDIWSAGAVLYEALAGRPPFEADTGPELIFKLATDAPPPLRQLRPDVPERLERLVARALARDPDARFQSARELGAALRGSDGDVSGSWHSAPGSSTDSLAPVVRAHDLGHANTISAEATSRRARILRRTAALSTMLVIAAVALSLATFRTQKAASTSTPPPKGMAWIDVGTLALGRSAQELEEECRNMGSRCDRSLMQREQPSAQLTIPPFLLDTREVTNQELAETLNELGPSLYVVEDEDDHYPRFVRWNKDLGHDGEFLMDLHPKYGGIEYTKDRIFRARPGHEQLPATQVSWYGARLHCGRLGKRLPSEDEWEAAARGPENRRFPWGAEAPTCSGVVLPRDGVIQSDPRCPEDVAPIQVSRSIQDMTPQKIHDLAGNVSEWVESPYVEGNRHAHPSDPKGLLPRVVRGGSWGASFTARTSGRARRPPGSVGANIGFRCAASTLL